MPIFCAEVRSASKRYSHKTALDSVSAVFRGGEIHALLGENGAGKSTLASVLAGKKQLSSGTLLVNGEPVSFRSQAESLRRGIALVEQHPHQSAALRVYENVMLGREPCGAFRFMLRRRALAEINELAESWNIRIDLREKSCYLSSAGRFYTALLAALYTKPSMLILDEPSVSLDDAEQTALYARLESAAAAGLSVVLITHSIADAARHADTITVLRKGAVAARFGNKARDISEQVMALHIKPPVPHGDSPASDEKTPSVRRKSAKTDGEVLLELRNICYARNGKPLLDNASFSVHAGKITVITGRHEEGLDILENIASGMDTEPYSGSVLLHGKKQRRLSPAQLRRFGCGIVPSSKLFRGSHPSLTVKEMLCAGIDKSFSEADAARLVKNSCVDIMLDDRVSSLSGGMLQRLIIARELSLHPRLLLLFEPSYGLDSVSAAALGRTLLSAAAENCGILIVSASADYLPSADYGYIFKHGRLFPAMHADFPKETYGEPADE
ncbi:MAG: ATP-binding cassette domain-containing protein [Bacteroides sp.]|nr:ATP-binding cassette domain-containing protein [Prevotella sp.]MCM1407738.1 ATP-binding cassette domain-containing protein [Treponema brennaborense]MCM1469112.1 ATP-binding cassette domain-containing protein [Bacteroides sp.]